jgi:hypothetical protein
MTVRGRASDWTISGMIKAFDWFISRVIGIDALLAFQNPLDAETPAS